MGLKDVVHRITCEPGHEHVQVMVDREVLAETNRPVLLRETGLPVRYYIPKSDVRMDLLQPTEHHTRCPWKGRASYWSAHLGDTVLENLAWSYEDPVAAAEPIRGLLCFYPDRVEIRVGGRRG